MNGVPTYALYGEADAGGREDWLHWETIQARSRQHGYRIAPHRHERFFQILSLTNGWGHVTLDGTGFDLRPPVVVVVPALTVHGFVFSNNVEGVVVTLLERDLPEGIESPPAAVIGGNTSAIDFALDALVAEADRPGGWHDLAMRSHITLLLVALQRARSVPATGDAGAMRARMHVSAFRFLVDKKFRETRRIADYAASLGISQTHLNRVCRQVLGISALAVVERRVALEARRQLLFSTLSIKQVGAGLGYDDPAYFTRVMKRVAGETPAALRSRLGQAIETESPDSMGDDRMLNGTGRD
jgi:AraC family transcriptional activator of pobA